MSYLLYIDANIAYLYGANVSDAVELDLSDPKIIHDLEVVNQEQLEAKILSFVDTNKIIPSGILIVLSNTFTFDKDFNDSATPKLYEEIQSFLSTVPFEDTYSKTYQIGKSSKIIAVNKAFCDVFITEFEKLKFTFSGVVPLQIVQSIMPEFSEKVNLKLLYGKLDALKQYRIFTPEKEAVKETEKTHKTTTKSKQPIILIGVFVFLLIILGVVAINTVFAPQPSVKKSVISAPPTPPTVSNSGQFISGEENVSPTIVAPSPTPTPFVETTQGSKTLNP